MILHLIELAAEAATLVFLNALVAELRARLRRPATPAAAPQPEPPAKPDPSVAPLAIPDPEGLQQELSMSTVSATVHNFEAMLEGKTDFNGFLSQEGALIEANIKSAPAVVQPILEGAFASFKATASVLVGAGETALGPIINTSSDTQATMLLNAMQAAGIPTSGVLTAAEHAGLVTLINGFKAYLDRMHLQYAVQAQPATDAQPAA